MTRLHLLLTIGCVTAAAATVDPASPKRPSPTPPSQAVSRDTAKSAPVNQSANTAWVASFGTYNVRQGSWNFIPNPNGC
jgi:hypothetical protein